MDAYIANYVRFVLYLTEEPPDDATTAAVYIVPKGIGIQEPSGGVSPGTRDGRTPPVQGWLVEKTLMRNCRGTLLIGEVLEDDMKSST